ncbi:hypothetical protein EVAR_86126_1 [Eumeta japonica]|uniref:Integrase p58-like C-terminal domain-containing protein n=1 Tax=Eumeta variegata TaxID=151549 RepID=A0A4C1V2I1_EUMVA|nr:hypothetical protein EVAR_86126_1 [Eumeta japonica]
MGGIATEMGGTFRAVTRINDVTYRIERRPKGTKNIVHVDGQSEAEISDLNRKQVEKAPTQIASEVTILSAEPLTISSMKNEMERRET